MKKLAFQFTVALAVAVSASHVVAQGAKQTLRLFIWSDYMDPAVIKDFEKKFGANVVIDTYESNESMLAKLQGGGARYDLAVPSDYIIQTMVKSNLLQELRAKNVPNLKNIASTFKSPKYDPGNKYSAAYQYSATAVAYRADKVKNPAQSWSVIFGSEDKIRFALLDDPREVIGAALKYLGYSLNSTSTQELAKARDLIVKTKAKKGFVGFDGGPGIRNKLLAGEIDLGQIYAGDGLQGAQENKNLKLFIPKEGTTISVDNLVVLKNAPNRDLAEKFVNFILDAKVGARISNYTQYATPNGAARQYLDPALKSNQALYPPAVVAKGFENIREVGSATRLYDRIWTQVKAR
ncbi:polyamine ABC transporter substrate-binding protein [Deinococcus yavapaiensis]|uniref:Spermidine/putrescine-binding protein n=1 Tax=Deinococcus yavapaiensis KR-236 TaxID=694435 RepID=A0A318SGQ0_9DEIO|nr:spermidine/putrescine ABC transporter substrate-binding protein [Deinococcus yavapaiensis]PYE56584.1 spermidine/putrescine-binding protein [Deinococcus yavapaiensis KR-236]